MIPNLLRITTVPISLHKLLQGQFTYMQQKGIEVVLASSNGKKTSQIEKEIALKNFVSDTLDKNVDFTNLIDFLPLNWTAKKWAQHIMNNNSYERASQYQRIKEKHYDIVENAKMLQEFYLKLMK